MEKYDVEQSFQPDCIFNWLYFNSNYMNYYFFYFTSYIRVTSIIISYIITYQPTLCLYPTLASFNIAWDNLCGKTQILTGRCMNQALCPITIIQIILPFRFCLAKQTAPLSF